MLWIYRFLCFFSLAVAIPMLSRKRWNKWFNKNHKSVVCSVHVGGLNEYMDDTKRSKYEAELARLFGRFGTVITTELRVRDVMDDGEHKVSWALVSFSGEKSASEAVSRSDELGKGGWVVKEVDMEQMENSEGAMKSIKAANHDNFHEKADGEFDEDESDESWQDEDEAPSELDDDEEAALAGPKAKKVLAM